MVARSSRWSKNWKPAPPANETDGLVIRGPLLRLDAQRDGFAGPDVASVEAMWGYADANFFWMGGYVVRRRDGRRAYIEGTSLPEFSEDGETYELEWTFDVRLLADEPYHSLTPLQPSEHRPYAWEEAPASLNEFLKRLAS